MAQLRQDYQEFVRLNTVVIAIGRDTARAFQSFWEARQLPFIGLPDPKGKVLKQYGQEIKLLKLGRMPAQVIVDIQGVVRYLHYGQNMADISTNKEIFDILISLNRPGQ
jgi:peroxiredoxin